MMRLFRWIWFPGLAACMTLGCVSSYASRVERNWGSAVLDNAEAMVANREGAGAEHDPGDPMEGLTVEYAIRSHRTTQAQGAAGAPQPSVINIGTVGR